MIKLYKIDIGTVKQKEKYNLNKNKNKIKIITMILLTKELNNT